MRAADDMLGMIESIRMEMQVVDMIDFERGIVNEGNALRLQTIMKKALNGNDICVGFIGGSITQGCLSSRPETCYAYRVYEWWKERYPNAGITYVNAGIGGTTSQFGVARAMSDLLVYRPDVIFVEFSVNDENTSFFEETYEGLVRKLYAHDKEPAVILIHSVRYDTGENAQEIHLRIGQYYDMPCISMKETIYPLVKEGSIQRRSITEDDLHPNDAGHKMMAEVIIYYLKKMSETKISKTEISLQNKTGNHIEDRIASIAPYTDNAYENAIRYQKDNTTPLYEGFSIDTREQESIRDIFKNGWMASGLGEAITFCVKGSEIAIQYRKTIKRPAPIAKVIIDGKEKEGILLDANFDEDWGDSLHIDTVLYHGEDKIHEIRVEIVETHPEDQVPFYLTSIIASAKQK